MNVFVLFVGRGGTMEHPDRCYHYLANRAHAHTPSWTPNLAHLERSRVGGL